MLDRQVVSEFLDDQLEDVPIPASIKKKELVEAFCQFTENDYYEWLKDNFSTFFDHGNPDWVWIKNYIDENKGKSDC